MPSFQPLPCHADAGGQALGTIQRADTDLNVSPGGGDWTTAPDHVGLFVLSSVSGATGTCTTPVMENSGGTERIA